MGNTESRQYLTQYKLSNLKLERLKQEYEEANERVDAISLNMDGMPHGTDISSKTENLAIKLADLDLEIKNMTLEVFALKKQIMVDIEHIQLRTPERTEIAKTVLKKRYIDSVPNDPKSKYKPTRWEDIYRELPYYGESTLRIYEKEGVNEIGKLLYAKGVR